MPPVNTSASSPDVDNEATAELPVLDVAAYELTLGERTDSWAVPNGALTPVTNNAVEATTAMPALPDESIPTLQAVDSGVRPRSQRHARNAADAAAEAQGALQGTAEVRAQSAACRGSTSRAASRPSAPAAPPPARASRRTSPRRSSCRRHRRSSKNCAMRWRAPSGASKSSVSARASPTPNATSPSRVSAPRTRSCASS